MSSAGEILSVDPKVIVRVRVKVEWPWVDEVHMGGSCCGENGKSESYEGGALGEHGFAVVVRWIGLLWLLTNLKKVFKGKKGCE